MKTKKQNKALFVLGCLLSPLAYAADAGIPDPKFGNDGHVIVPFDLGSDMFDDVVRMIAAPGGKTYAIGRSSMEDPNFGWMRAITIARFDSDGALDQTYGNGGKTYYTDPERSGISANDAALAPNGKLVVVGGSAGNSLEMTACRFTEDGHIDLSFGDKYSKGCVHHGLEFESSNAFAVAMRGDGRSIYVAGHEANVATVIALTPGGRKDPSFGTQGVARFSPGEFNDIAFNADNELVAVGLRTDLMSGFHGVVAKIDATSGTLDAAFGEDGMVDAELTRQGNSGGTLGLVALAPGGSIVVSGIQYTPEPNSEQPFVARLLSSGAYDPGFGDDGVVGFPCEDSWNDCTVINDIAVTADDQVLVAQTDIDLVQPDTRLSRFTPGGTLDPTFGDGGDVSLDFGLGDAGAVYPVFAMQGARPVIGAGVFAKADTDFGVSRLGHGLNEVLSVTPSASPNGTLLPADPVAVSHSDYTFFTVVPDDGYEIKKVSGCGGMLKGSVYVTGAVVDDCEISAEFIEAK